MINLEQIKADIAARKAMPAWGANTSIERIKTINATLPSFSLKTVEALVERIAELEGALEVSQGDLCDTEDAMHLWAERAKKAESELESRTVKLPPKIERNDVDGWFTYKGGRVGGGAAEWYNKALDDVSSAHTAAVTVKLPKPISVLHRRDFTDAHRAIYAYPEAEVNAALDDAGIKVEAGTFRENESSSTGSFREIQETSTKGGNQ